MVIVEWISIDGELRRNDKQNLKFANEFILYSDDLINVLGLLFLNIDEGSKFLHLNSSVRQRRIVWVQGMCVFYQVL